MNPFRRSSLFILVLLVGAIVALACTDDDGALTATDTPAPPSAPTPDIGAIVETAVRETLGTIPAATPAPTQDIEAIVETVVRRTLETLSTTIVATETTSGPPTIAPSPSGVAPEPTPVSEPQVQAVEVRAAPAPSPARFASLSKVVEGFSALPIAQELSEAGGSHRHGQWLGKSNGGRGLRSRDPRTVLRGQGPRKALQRGPCQCGTESHGHRHQRG